MAIGMILGFYWVSVVLVEEYSNLLGGGKGNSDCPIILMQQPLVPMEHTVEALSEKGHKRPSGPTVGLNPFLPWEPYP